MSDSCQSCKFSAPSVGAYPEALECRRRPPVDCGRRPVAQWPKVYPDSWCGEYEQKTPTRQATKKRPTVGDMETRSEQG